MSRKSRDGKDEGETEAERQEMIELTYQKDGPGGHMKFYSESFDEGDKPSHVLKVHEDDLWKYNNFETGERVSASTEEEFMKKFEEKIGKNLIIKED